MIEKFVGDVVVLVYSTGIEFVGRLEQDDDDNYFVRYMTKMFPTQDGRIGLANVPVLGGEDSVVYLSENSDFMIYRVEDKRFIESWEEVTGQRKVVVPDKTIQLVE